VANCGDRYCSQPGLRDWCSEEIAVQFVHINVGLLRVLCMNFIIGSNEKDEA
jgi:hypothetical protein